MPHRTGLSHALFAVVVSVLWIAFYRSLEVVVSKEDVLFVIEFLATWIHEYTGLSPSYGVLVTIVTFSLLTVLGFAWGYAFHLRTFGRNQ